MAATFGRLGVKGLRQAELVMACTTQADLSTEFERCQLLELNTEQGLGAEDLPVLAYISKKDAVIATPARETMAAMVVTLKGDRVSFN